MLVCHLLRCVNDLQHLQEAKELVEGVPKMLKKEMAKADAEKLVAKLKEVGAECAMD